MSTIDLTDEEKDFVLRACTAWHEKVFTDIQVMNAVKKKLNPKQKGKPQIEDDGE
ncbi:MAG: hypothetical protein KKE71_06680 [Nanoarchaeota archaeon]|nr:hypothetical protein [Nanoarchaeota archaeon]MBU4300963.1 hypothetical protein [Nanoarchaeota archaeon]